MMKMKLMFKMVFVTCCVLFSTNLTYGNLVINGNFSSSVPVNSTGGGWTSSHINHVGGWYASWGNPDGCFYLNDFGASSSDPTISQIIDGLSAGQSYLITGDFKNIDSKYGNPNALSFGVAIDGDLLLELDRPDGGDWETFAIEFVASAKSQTLSLTSERNGDDSSYLIDNIAINGISSVPLPSAVGLVGFGLLSLIRSRKIML